MKIVALLLSVGLTAILVQTATARALDTSVASGIKDHLVGDWCLNKEELGDDVSYSGEIWRFTKSGQYKFGLHSLDSYTVKEEEIKLANMGTLKVLEIDQDKMVAKVYSTYYFSKNKCSNATLNALKITLVNNAIISNDIDYVKKLIKEGVDISLADSRSSIQSTPLMVAIRSENKEIIELLLMKNPDLTITDYMGRTAFDIAQKSDSKEIRERIEDAY